MRYHIWRRLSGFVAGIDEGELVLGKIESRPAHEVDKYEAHYM